MQDFIDDGYTIQGRIRAVLGQHNQCDFTYRPLVDDEGSHRNRKINNAPPAEQAKLKRELIAERITAWSLKDSEGNVAPVNDEWIKKLPTQLHNALYLVALGFMSPDALLDDEGKEIDPSTLSGDLKN